MVQKREEKIGPSLKVRVLAGGAALAALLTAAAVYYPSSDVEPVPGTRYKFCTVDDQPTRWVIIRAVKGPSTTTWTVLDISRTQLITFSNTQEHTADDVRPRISPNGDVCLVYGPGIGLPDYGDTVALSDSDDDVRLLADMIAGVCRSDPTATRKELFTELAKTGYYQNYLRLSSTAGEANCSVFESVLFAPSAVVFPYKRVDCDLRLPNAPAAIINGAYPAGGGAVQRAVLTFAGLLGFVAAAVAIV
jgi:hypothetical protein